MNAVLVRLDATLQALGRPVVLGIDWALAGLGIAARTLLAAPVLRREPARAEFLRFLRIGLPGSARTVAIAALLIGVTLIGQGLYWLTVTGQGGLLDDLMIRVLGRELAPMLAALALLGKLGTLNLIELAELRAGPAWRGLLGQGVDPWRLLVVPRALAAGVAGFVHTVFAFTVAALGGYLTALLLGATTLRPALFLGQVLDAAGPADLLLVTIKGPLLAFGMVLGTSAAALGSARLAADLGRLMPWGLAAGAGTALGLSVLVSVLA